VDYGEGKMSEADRYLQAGIRTNTQKSYRSAVEHFEVTWGGLLPATGDDIVRYLAEYADQHEISTLRLRLAALAQWHITQGFPDPTKTPMVRQILKSIRALHPAQGKQAAPLLLRHLEQAVGWLQREAVLATERNDHKSVIRCRRDIALVLIGFWRGFRGDELARLRVENTRAEAGIGITFYLPHTPDDWRHVGTSFHTPALKKLCPVEAYIDWIAVSGITRGPVFRGIDCWGNLSEDEMNPSMISLLRRIFEKAGVPADTYSCHSMRSGFATWAVESGWGLNALVTYVGWKDIKSAAQYIDSMSQCHNVTFSRTNDHCHHKCALIDSVLISNTGVICSEMPG
jgi:integrase